MAQNFDFRIQVGWRKHIKLRRLARRFGSDGLVGWMGLIEYATEHRPDGDLGALDLEELGMVCGMDTIRPNGCEEFGRALVELALVDLGGDGRCRVHGWEEWQPYASKAGDRKDAAARGGLKSGAIRAKLWQPWMEGLTTEALREVLEGIRSGEIQSESENEPPLNPPSNPPSKSGSTDLRTPDLSYPDQTKPDSKTVDINAGAHAHEARQSAPPYEPDWDEVDRAVERFAEVAKNPDACLAAPPGEPGDCEGVLVRGDTIDLFDKHRSHGPEILGMVLGEPGLCEVQEWACESLGEVLGVEPADQAGQVIPSRLMRSRPFSHGGSSR